jgi:hypothetical protein
MLAIIEIFFEVIFTLFGEVLLEGVICGFFCLLGDFISAVFEAAGDAAEAVGEAIEGATETVATAKVGCLMIVIMLAMGALAGYVIYLVWPDKIFESIPVTGISLLITPLIIGGLMSLWGICKLSLNYASSFPATFLGGALFGLAAAGTRLALLA